MNKSVDIIIPTYRPDETVVYLIKKLLKQTYPIHEIHIIDTETGIFPKELKNLSDKIRISKIKPEQFDHGGTRHEGAMQSHADIIVYMTQDAMPVNEYLVEELVKAFDNEKIAATYARQLPNSKCNVIERYTRSFNYPEQSRIKSLEDLETLGIKTYFCSDVCAAYRKSVYESLGGFEEKTIFNEDMIMAAKIIQSGGLVKYVAEAKVIHSHNYNDILTIHFKPFHCNLILDGRHRYTEFKKFKPDDSINVSFLDSNDFIDCIISASDLTNYIILNNIDEINNYILGKGKLEQVINFKLCNL